MFAKATILGNIGREPELKSSRNGPWLSIPVATSYMATDKDGNKSEETNWFKVVLFGSTAENLARICGKGSLVLFDGQLRIRKDAHDKSVPEIIVDTFKIVHAKDRQPTPADVEPKPAAPEPASPPPPAPIPASEPADTGWDGIPY